MQRFVTHNSSLLPPLSVHPSKGLNKISQVVPPLSQMLLKGPRTWEPFSTYPFLMAMHLISLPLSIHNDEGYQTTNDCSAFVIHLQMVLFDFSAKIIKSIKKMYIYLEYYVMF